MEPGLLLWTRHFLGNSSKQAIMHHSEGMRQMGAAIAPLMEEMFSELGLDRTWHNFHRTPGLLLSRPEDPEAAVRAKRGLFDQVGWGDEGAVQLPAQVLTKHYLTGPGLEQVKAESGMEGLGPAGHTLGCLEPDNLTVDTARLGASLRRELEGRGVRFLVGVGEGRLVAEGGRVLAVELPDGHRVSGDRFVVCAGYGSRRLVAPLGLKLPLLPITAYSLHIPGCGAAAGWRLEREGTG
jgi:glycine/D-amino acid oxidase-like deaminating enzyme